LRRLEITDRKRKNQVALRQVVVVEEDLQPLDVAKPGRDELDLAIVPDAFEDPRLASHPVGKVEQAWMCKPDLVDTRKPLRLHELPKYRLLLQSDKSGAALVVDRWLGTLGVKLTGALRSSNMLALIGMTVPALGVTYLPLRCLHPMVENGMPFVLKVTPAPLRDPPTSPSTAPNSAAR
jgi:DNA-binding transcriptional LysR family regulator